MCKLLTNHQSAIFCVNVDVIIISYTVPVHGCAMKVPKLMEFLRSRSLRPGLGKLPIVPVIVVIDAGDPR